MNSRGGQIFSSLLAIVIIAAILPSFTALSESYTQMFPDIASRTGPLNPFKFFTPFLFIFVAVDLYKIRDRSERRGYFLLGGAWVIGTLFTTLAASRCGFPSMFLREWATITLGLLVGIALRVFPPGLRDRVFFGWLALVFLAVLLDLFLPTSIDWLYAHVFDPETRKWDLLETGVPALTGVFGRQSAAKLMAWLPWLSLPLVFKRPKRDLYLALAAIGVWSGLILATSQRGPMLASFGALFVFGVHRAWRERDPQFLVGTAFAIGIGFASIFVTVPYKIIGPRLLHQPPVESTGAPVKNSKEILEASEHNAHFRYAMARVSLDAIREYPLGNACLPKSFFTERKISEAHSHNLFLEQFRSRGWIWGLLHLGLWLLAGFAFFRRSDARASAYLAVITAIFICGFVDHPWFVLNQAIVLGAVLVDGVVQYFTGTSGTSDAV